MEWTKAEDKLIEKFFNSSTTELTLYMNLHKLNPHRTFEAMTRRLRTWKEKGWTRVKDKAFGKLRIGYLDIEATALNASFGYMLSWYIKTAGVNEFKFGVITKDEIFNETFDRRIVEELLVALNSYDVIYVYYGGDWRYDIPFIRTRAFCHGLEHLLPKYMEKFFVDLFPLVKSKLRLYNNRLATVIEAVGIKNVKKTPLSPKMWCLAAIGNKRALEYIALHNKRDVQTLERVHKKLQRLQRPNSMSSL
jgi:uncharacterized protein YprB with RNaseH-like and TPR domain